MESLGIYIHIPFCVRKCAYCDFLSFSGLDDRFREYVSALSEEISGSRHAGRTVDTIFIGGGTPSIIDPAFIGEILAKIREKFKVLPDAEITIEGNPDSITQDKLKKYLSFGINRLSMGFQSLDKGALEIMGRVHSGEQAVRAFFDAREAGFANVNVDIIFGIPGDDRRGVRETIDRIVGMGPEHVSAYSLIVEEGTEIWRKIKKGELGEPDDEIDREDYRYICQALEKAGYVQYEISNFAKAGFQSKHNMRYWKQQEYVGFGLGASSFVNGRRFSNTENLNEYIKSKGSGQLREDILLSKDELMDEFFMLGFRMLEGPDFKAFEEKYGVNPSVKYESKLKKLESQGLISKEHRLTEKGLDFANEIFEEFV